MSGGAGGGTVLCRLDDIADPGGRGFDAAGLGRIFVIRRGDAVFGYANACPHQGTPLDWKPDTFLTYDKTLIQCSTHGARFTIDDGLCVIGPCVGKHLRKVAVRVENGRVTLDKPPP